ncbi:hypothetical protein GLV94_02945 [Virgibacillus halodenitrificans]|uniref:hypothetical protein n=1 Tax=Virgibacillus halodenitrificans TaxID=1482 RepID=UPI00136F3714|nr:hypothetical protein [Virgibacillus halodenitrificans]MYL44590.1 hypothetical protein [Virgibacillus halodenitrificans]
MPMPPMNDNIKVFVPMIDENGQPVTDKYGRPVFNSPIESKARVKYTSKADYSQTDQSRETVVEANIPPTTQVQEGYDIEWTDRFHNTVREKVEGVTEALNYSGSKVYYRTIYINKSPTRR